MTTEELTGRALDAEVARVVFGSDTEQRRWHAYEVNPWACDVCGKGRVSVSGTKTGPCFIPIPSYSSDMTSAMLVFDCLVEIGLQVLLARDPGDPYEVEVCTTEELYGQGYRGCVIEDASAPRGICRAALKALDKKGA